MTAPGDPSRPSPTLPAGARQVVLPAALLHQAVPRMDDPAELLVTLYGVAGVQRLRRFPRLLDVAALRAERPLVAALARFFPHADVDAVFRRGLEAAVSRGTLLRAAAQPVPTDGAPARAPSYAEVLTLNSESDARALDRWRRGQLAATGQVPIGTARAGTGAAVAPQPGPQAGAEINVYALYEATVGPITPQIADALAEAEGLYPPAWIEDAFREAAELNKRSWRYIQRILERWDDEGRDDDDAPSERRAGWRSASQFDHLIRR